MLLSQARSQKEWYDILSVPLGHDPTAHCWVAKLCLLSILTLNSPIQSQRNFKAGHEQILDFSFTLVLGASLAIKAAAALPALFSSQKLIVELITNSTKIPIKSCQSGGRSCHTKNRKNIRIEPPTFLQKISLHLKLLKDR